MKLRMDSLGAGKEVEPINILNVCILDLETPRLGIYILEQTVRGTN